MIYRRLGRTGLRVSVLGIGGGYLSVVSRDLGERIFARAAELGVNYYDGRYGDSNRKLAPALTRDRSRWIVATKTREPSAEGVLRRIEEDIAELGSDYLDIFMLRTYSHEMLREHLAPGGAFDGALKAREQGKVRFIGLANHGDLTVLEAGIATGLVDVILFPLNVVRREALASLIPLAQRHDVGLAVMKPLSVGMLPAELALPWLAEQPIHTMVPGISSLEQLEADVRHVTREPSALSPAEKRRIEALRQQLDGEVCRICDHLCQPCEAGMNVSWMIHHDVWYNHYLNMGLDAFLAYDWAPDARAMLERHFAQRLAAIAACTRCGRCEDACPHGLQILDRLERMRTDHSLLLAALCERGRAASADRTDCDTMTRTR